MAHDDRTFKVIADVHPSWVFVVKRYEVIIKLERFAVDATAIVRISNLHNASREEPILLKPDVTFGDLIVYGCIYLHLRWHSRLLSAS
jgi:hypothetical protein